MSTLPRRLTAELVALCERPEPDYGRPAGTILLTNADYEALADRLIAENGDGPLWVFIYGSLMWKPVFTPAEELRARAPGWHRSFYLVLTNWRGTPHQPGLMMALERGGSCNGVVARIADDEKRTALIALLRREAHSREHAASIRWINVVVGDKRMKSLAFWAGARDVPVQRRLAPEQVAHTLARACGHGGSGAAYLFHTVAGLEDRGIHDRGLWRLQELVAAEIAELHGVGDVE